MFFFATQQLFPVFANYLPNWRCSSSGEEFGKNCTAYESCNGNVEFERIDFHSSALEFGIICGASAYLRVVYAQMQFGGILIGTFIFAAASDRFGRRTIGLFVLVGGAISLVLSGEQDEKCGDQRVARLSAALAPTWQLLLASRALVGAFVGGNIVALLTLCMECVLPEQRMPIRTIANWGNGRLLITALCALAGDWRGASIACAAVAVVPLLLLVFVVPESPMWYHAKQRVEQMRRSERQMARIAGVEYVEREPPPMPRQLPLRFVQTFSDDIEVFYQNNADHARIIATM